MLFSPRNLLFLAGVAFAMPSPAQAQTIVWKFQNFTAEVVSVELYSKARNHVWPGHGQVWLVPPDRVVYSNPISCLRGEQICFGGWADRLPNRHWGVGRGGREGCVNCCYHCVGGQTQVIQFIY